MDKQTQKGKTTDQLLSKPGKFWVIGLSITAALVPIGIAVYILQNYQLNFPSRSSLTQTPASTPAVTSIAALGRLEPEGEIIHLSAAPSSEGIGVKVAQMLVKEGDMVQPGRVIAILDNRERLLADQEQAKKQVKVAQANLAKVRSGAKQGEIVAQQAAITRLQAEMRGQVATQQSTIARLQAEMRGQIATQQSTIARLQAQLQGEKSVQQAKISRLEAQLRNALAEFKRYQMLYQQGAVEASKFDSKRLEMETAREQLQEAEATRKQTVETLQQQINEAEATRKRTVETLQQQINEAKATRQQTVETLQQHINEAKATLNQITEVRPTDLQAAEAEVESTIAALKKAEVNLASAYVRSPVSGRILKINARPGEIVREQGIVELGQTSQIYAVAEVYETDISKVQIGQRATVTSLAFADKLRGTVTEIGLQIEKKSILDTDPTADLDARVVKVKIRLDPADNKKVTGLTNLQVEAVINISPPHQE